MPPKNIISHTKVFNFKAEASGLEKTTPLFSSYQAVGVYLLGLHLLVCGDLLNVLLSFLQPVTKRPTGTSCVQILGRIEN